MSAPARESDAALTSAIADVQAALRPVLEAATTEQDGRTLVLAVLGVAGELGLRLVTAQPTEALAVWRAYNSILLATFPAGDPTQPRGTVH